MCAMTSDHFGESPLLILNLCVCVCVCVCLCMCLRVLGPYISARILYQCTNIEQLCMCVCVGVCVCVLVCVCV